MNKRGSRKSLYTNSSGFTLLGTVLVMVITSIIGMTLLNVTSNSLNISSIERDSQSAFYIAEAALTVEMANVEETIHDVYSRTDNEYSFFSTLTSELTGERVPYTNFEQVFGKNPKAIINVEELNEGNPREYKITSTGIIEEERTIEQKFYVEWASKSGVPDMALFVSNNISLAGGGYIKGDIATLSSQPNTITAKGGARVDGKIYVPVGYEKLAVDKPSWMTTVPDAEGKDFGEMPKLPSFPEIPSYRIPDDVIIQKDDWNKSAVIKNGDLLVNDWITNNYTLNMSDNMQFNNIEIKQNNTLNINTGTSDKEIVVKDLNIQNGHINIIGRGGLTIYVTGEMNFGSASSVNKNGKVNKLNIFLKGSDNPKKRKEVKLSGGQVINGSLFAEDADIKFTGGSGFIGNIFTGGKEISVSGGNWTEAPLILAPNADFTLSGGGNIKGSVIARSFAISGGGSLEYVDPQIKEGPISGEQLGSGEVIITKEPLLETN